MAKHNEIGKIGEDIAVKYLIGKDFNIIKRNHLCKIGEIDIVASDKESLIFVEVKSKKVKDFDETKQIYFKPEDNMSYEKKIKMKKAIKHYLLINNINEYQEKIEIMLIVVFIKELDKKARIKMYRNLFL